MTLLKFIVHLQQQQQQNSDGNIENHGPSNRSASPIQNKQINPSQHVASPTPTLAFTPTSVLRKMTAEKDPENVAAANATGNIGTGGNNKDNNKVNAQFNV